MKVLEKTKDGIKTIFPQHLLVADDELLMARGDIVISIPHSHQDAQEFANSLARVLGIRVSRAKRARDS